MSELRINQLSSTLGSVVIISGVLAACCNLPDKGDSNAIVKNGTYTLNNNSSTFSGYEQNINKASFKDEENGDFKRTVEDFYSNLLSSQETLGEEFEIVLFTNLWDLYES